MLIIMAESSRKRLKLLRHPANAGSMQFPNASNVPVDMLYPKDGTAFDMPWRIIDHEYVDPQDMEMRGMLAALGIIKGITICARRQCPQAARSRYKDRLQDGPRGVVRAADHRAQRPMVFGPALAERVPGQRDLSPPIPSTISTRAPASSPMPTRRAPAWRSTWRMSGPSIPPPSSTHRTNSYREARATSSTSQKTFQSFGTNVRRGSGGLA